MIICRPYTEETAADFRQLFLTRFQGGNESIPRTILDNPARKADYDAGSIAYDERNTVVAIHGLLPRVVYCGSKPLKATSGVALAVRKDANRDFFTGFLRDSIEVSGADVFLANTAVPGSRKRGAAALDMLDGPESCSIIRERDLMAGKGVFARVMRKLRTKLGIGCYMPSDCSIDEAAFDGFWRRYLEGHQGLVTSRTAVELKWVFDAGLKTGEVILVTAVREGELVGYAFCRRTDKTAACWRVVDMIALGDDEAILEELIASASAFLRHHAPATCLQITGFPMWVQPLLKRLFPKHSSFGFNKCVWAFLNDRAKDVCGDWVNAASGWYGCPYDGDMCLA